MEAVTGERSEPATPVSPGPDVLALARPHPRPPPRPPVDGDGVIDTGQRLPPAAARPVGSLFVLTLLSAVDGSLLALAAAGRLTSLADAVTIGLVVVAGAGSWLAANQAFAGRRRTGSDWGLLGLLGALTLASTVASVWLGARLGDALTLHVLPKGAGLVLFLVGAEVAGLRLPKPGRVPLPALGLALVLVAEVGLQWTA